MIQKATKPLTLKNLQDWFNLSSVELFRVKASKIKTMMYKNLISFYNRKPSCIFFVGKSDVNNTLQESKNSLRVFPFATNVKQIIFCFTLSNM